MKQLNSVTVKQSSHNLWHHLAMVFVSEINNLIWFVCGIVIVIAGWVIYKFSNQFFFEVAVGLPLVFVGASLALMKIYEIILTVIDPRRLKATCILCRRH